MLERSPRGSTISRTFLAVIVAVLLPSSAIAGVDPLLTTTWGQGPKFQEFTPKKNGAGTHPGCTTIAAAQVLYYFRYAGANPAAPWIDGEECYWLENGPLDETAGGDVSDGGYQLCVNLTDYRPPWSDMALSDKEAKAKVSATAKFIYNVGVVLHLQFGGGEGASSTGRFIQDGFVKVFGYPKATRSANATKILLVDAFFRDSTAFATYLRGELDAGRPVMYMAQEAEQNIGHAFVIDGYNDAGLFHVNWGWGGASNGYFDLSLTDPSGRSWTRNAMIYQNLSPPGWKKPGTPPGPKPPVVETRSRDQIILAVANDAKVTTEILRGMGLTKRVAADIVGGRPFASAAAVDAAPGVGPATLEKLHKYGVDNGYDKVGP
jgi:hypothetical protein